MGIAWLCEPPRRGLAPVSDGETPQLQSCEDISISEAWAVPLLVSGQGRRQWANRCSALTEELLFALGGSRGGRRVW